MLAVPSEREEIISWFIIFLVLWYLIRLAILYITTGRLVWKLGRPSKIEQRKEELKTIIEQAEGEK
jgi:hypothetical protein